MYTFDLWNVCTWYRYMKINDKLFNWILSEENGPVQSNGKTSWATTNQLVYTSCTFARQRSSVAKWQTVLLSLKKQSGFINVNLILSFDPCCSDRHDCRTISIWRSDPRDHLCDCPFEVPPSATDWTTNRPDWTSSQPLVRRSGRRWRRRRYINAARVMTEMARSVSRCSFQQVQNALDSVLTACRS